MLEREVAEVVKGIRHMQSNRSTSGNTVAVGKVTANGGLVINGRMYSYTLAVDIPCNIGDNVYAIIIGRSAVVVGR